LFDRFLRHRDQQQQQQQQLLQQPVNIITIPLSDLIDTFNIPSTIQPYTWAMRQPDCALSYLTEEQIRLIMLYSRILESSRASFEPTTYHRDVLGIVYSGIRELGDNVQLHILTLCRAMRSYHGFTMKVTQGRLM